ncbi:MAG TPA: calcium/proton exchanger [Candidatus Paceibacterota bacterium]|nr:calcium/proton exchanger [Candidatus Paceibacterota bacterium]
MNQFFLALLIFVPLTAIAAYLGWSPVAVFVLSAIALAPLAKFIGDATEDLSARTGPAIGGLLNATFGNATELMVGLFALNAGLIEVVKASITGSIIGNLLLVLGTAMLAGGWKRERQHFNATAAKATGSSLILATTALVIPAIFLLTGGGDQAEVEHLSILVSLLLILAYGASLLFSLHTHKHLYQEEAQVAAPKWSTRTCVLVLLASTLAAAYMSDTLVGAIEPLVATLGWTQLFIGVVIVAIAGNVGEHFAAVTAAMKDRMDLSLQISIGSATQIVMFVAPLLVIASVFIGAPMDLVFHLFELVAIIFTVIVTYSVVEDGMSNWFEGFQLLIAYVIMAVAFYFHA